jgi:hypothetical protein
MTKSIRLTTSVRSEIIQRAVKALIEPRRAALKDAEAVIADEVIAYHIGSKNLALMAQLPPEYFESKSSFYAVCKNYRSGSLTSKKGAKVPANMRYDLEVQLPETHGLWKKIKAHEVSREAIEQDEIDLKVKMRGLLDGCTTTKTLLEAWPEVKDYLPDFAAPTVNLPAIRSEDLNSFIAKLKK